MSASCWSHISSPLLIRIYSVCGVCVCACCIFLSFETFLALNVFDGTTTKHIKSPSYLNRISHESTEKARAVYLFRALHSIEPSCVYRVNVRLCVCVLFVCVVKFESLSSVNLWCNRVRQNNLVAVIQNSKSTATCSVPLRPHHHPTSLCDNLQI